MRTETESKTDARFLDDLVVVCLQMVRFSSNVSPGCKLVRRSWRFPGFIGTIKVCHFSLLCQRYFDGSGVREEYLLVIEKRI